MAVSMLKKSLFIVFEGLDRSGKSTQVNLLHNYLTESKRDNVVIKFPDRETNIGKVIDSYLRKEANDIGDNSDELIHLLFTANRWENVPKIRKFLAEGKIIICDRYSYSGIAYSHAKNNLTLDWCQAVENGLPKPDVVFFMDVSASTSCKRDGFGEEIYEKQEFQERVHKSFKEQIESGNVNWKRINADQLPAEIHESIKTIVNELLE